MIIVAKNESSALDNGSKYTLSLDENLLLFGGSNVSINESVMSHVMSTTHIVYDSLKALLNAMDLKEEILKSKTVIIAYDDRISYCEALKLIVDIFGSVPYNFRIISKLHLVAFYCGANRMNAEGCSYMRLVCGSVSCKVECEDGIVEIKEDIVSTDGISYPTMVLSPDYINELLAGAVLQHLILLGQVNGLLLLDAVPFNVSCGFFSAGVQQELFSAYTIIPTRNVIDLDKKRDELDIWVGGEKFTYPLLNWKDEKVRINAEIQTNGVVYFNISSSINKYSKTISILDLLIGGI